MADLHAQFLGDPLTEEQTRELYRNYKVTCPHCSCTTTDPDHMRKCQKERALIFGSEQ